jgi:cytochrome P450
MILTVPGHNVPFTPRWRGQQAQKKMWGLLRELIAERRRALGDDALSQLIRAHDGHGGERRARLNEDQLLVHAFTLLAAGHETSAAYLTFALAVLAVRPELMERVVAELDTLPRCGPPTLKQLNQLEFTFNLLREVERMYPPTPYVARRAMVDLECGGYRIKRGSTLMGSVRLTHLMPSLFKQPMLFDPDRFAPPREEHKTRFALIGFGGGPHLCLGIHFAQIEACVLLHTLLRRYRFRLRGGAERLLAHFFPFCEPRYPLRMQVEVQ